MNNQKASREMDAEVAEKVMRLVVHSRDRGYYLVYGDRYPESALGADCAAIPRYSADIGAAWEVVLWAREIFSRWETFTVKLQAEVSAGCGVTVHPSAVWRLVQPDHICRAAIRTVENVPKVEASA